MQAASGGPLVQHSLQVMLELAKDGLYSRGFVVDKMCHAPAKLFGVKIAALSVRAILLIWF